MNNLLRPDRSSCLSSLRFARQGHSVAGIVYLVCLSLQVTVAAEPASTAVLTGRVFSKAADAYIRNARVVVQGTNLQTITDENGGYRLTGVPPGNIQVTASYLGLESRSETIHLPPGGSPSSISS